MKNPRGQALEPGISEANTKHTKINNPLATENGLKQLNISNNIN